MTLFMVKHLPQRVLLLLGLLVVTSMAGLAQELPSATPSPAARQVHWEAIENPENTDFWDAMTTSSQAGESDPSAARADAEPSLLPSDVGEAEAGRAKAVSPDENVVRGEQESIEALDGAVQGGAAGTEEAKKRP